MPFSNEVVYAQPKGLESSCGRAPLPQHYRRCFPDYISSFRFHIFFCRSRHPSFGSIHLRLLLRLLCPSPTSASMSSSNDCHLACYNPCSWFFENTPWPYFYRISKRRCSWGQVWWQPLPHGSRSRDHESSGLFRIVPVCPLFLIRQQQACAPQGCGWLCRPTLLYIGSDNIPESNHPPIDLGESL